MKKKFRLAPFFRIGFQSKILYLGFGSIQKEITLPDLQKKYLKVLNKFISPTHHSSLDNQEQEIMDGFIKKNILIPDDLYNPKNRYSRHHLYFLMSGANPKDVQEKLKKSHLLVLGCGGIGSLIATALAASGIGKLTLVDNDKIELTNLTRQYYFKEKDIGKYKVDVLKKTILEKNSKCKVIGIKKHIKRGEDLSSLPKSDFIIASADVDNVCDLINIYSINEKIPWLNIGYVEDVAVWGPLVIPGKTGCLACQENIAKEEDGDEKNREIIKKINKNYQAPSTGPINMLSVSLAMFDILRYLGNFGQIQSLNKRIGLWTNDLKLEKQDYTKNPDCKVCSNS
jgi:molybdopterin-synthase adenylyltransferase